MYAEALLRNGQFEAAAGLASGPLLGEALLAQGDLEGAAMLVEDPELVEWIAARQGHLQSATTAPAGLLIGQPTGSTVQGYPEHWLGEAELRAEGGDIENATRLTLRALNAQEDLPTLLLATELLIQLNEDTLPFLARAAELAETPEQRVAVALIQAELAENPDVEVATLEEAASLVSPVPGELLYRLSMAYEASGRRPEAARAAVVAADSGYEPARRYVASRYREAGRPEIALRYE